MATVETEPSAIHLQRDGWRSTARFSRAWLSVRTPRLIAMLLVLGWGGHLIQDSHAVYERLGETALPVAPAAPVTLSDETHFEITKATSLHLFGKIDHEPTAPLDTASLPDTSASLSLVGLFFSTHPSSSSTLIAAQGAAAKRYREGDELTGGAVLHRIEPNGIILKRGEQFERLLLAKSLIGANRKSAPNIEDLVQLSMASSAPESSAQLSEEKHRRPSDIFQALDSKLAALRDSQK